MHGVRSVNNVKLSAAKLGINHCECCLSTVTAGVNGKKAQRFDLREL